MEFVERGLGRRHVNRRRRSPRGLDTADTGQPATTFVFRVPFSAFSDAPACHSYLSASIGSRLAALTAGNIPLTTPTSARMVVATSNIFGATTKVMSPASACLASAL